MRRVGLETTIPAFDREEKVHALDRMATAIGINQFHAHKNRRIQRFTFKFRLNIMPDVGEVAGEIPLQFMILRHMTFPLS
jgi:hypothetical protein